MVPMEAALIALVAFAVAIAAIASIRVITERETLGRLLAQLAFVWFVPLLGPLATIHFLRKEPEHGSGKYSSADSQLGDDGKLNLRDATFGSALGSIAENGETTGGSHE